MKAKDHYNVLAVYSLRDFAGREHFTGLLEAMSNVSDWRLCTVQQELFTADASLVNGDGEPFDGLILSMPGTDEMMERIANSRTPTVLVDITDRRLSARCDAIASVWTDNADIGRRAARHLLKRGEYGSAGFVHEFNMPFYSTERMTAFRREMKSAGLDTSVFPGDGGDGDYSARLREWIARLPKPAAVMAASDMRAADAINACRAEGIPVPAQVSVVGVDHDTAQHEKCGMSISSVVINSRMLGMQAVKELDFIFRHPGWKGRPHEILVPAKDVIAGESTARSVSAARLVDIALDFIAANRARNLSTADVVAHLGCSRRLAELRFSQVSGTTIGKAIENARMDEVRRRLGNGDSVASIVKAMRFTSANLLYRVYKRHFGCTIREAKKSSSRAE